MGSINVPVQVCDSWPARITSSPTLDRAAFISVLEPMSGSSPPNTMSVTPGALVTSAIETADSAQVRTAPSNGAQIARLLRIFQPSSVNPHLGSLQRPLFRLSSNLAGEW